ncbi:hypothetical protein D9756_004149 [Leucocoprinus leucothites]|uniref:Cytochrome P450 n=1 Tax=Leucocoprinus leucothites TaxID=201217 RepID=A0A8H5D9U4_9AGAR|nr:hypothetical protein D9756_004149 [Leucoagaricus leucothites]
MPSWSTLPLTTAVLLFAYCVSRELKRRTLGRTPPGPKGWPIVGNISDIPHSKSWLTYVEWRKIYGDIVYVEPFGSPTVILNNLEDIRELLDKRSAITASRPRMVMANELMGWDWDFVHMPHDDYWRRHRKVFHQYFQQKNIPNYYPTIRRSTANLLNQLAQSPSRFREHIKQLAAATILKLTYDHEVASENDYYVSLAHRALQGLLPVVHIGSSVVDVIPILKHIPAWFPGASFKRTAQRNAKYSSELRDVPFSQAKQKMATNTIEPCFVSDSFKKDGADEEVVKNAAGIAYLGKPDLQTASVIEFFFLAMLRYPEVQARARQEIDAVTGGNRLPDFDDRSSLPYVDLIIAELFRWRPTTPLGMHHQSQQPDTYKGYYFPAGTKALFCVPLGCTHVINCSHSIPFQDIFSEPEKFRPERFLKENAELDPRSMGGFGYGRRVCPGRYLADSSAWLAIAQVLAAFTIQPKRDTNDKDILPSLEYGGGVIM